MLIIAALLLACTPMSIASEAEALPTGTRVRVTLAGTSKRLSGTVSSLDHQTLAVEGPKHGIRTFRLNEVAKVEASSGRRSRWVEGAVLGVVAGTAIACARTRPCIGPGNVVFAVPGALLGVAFKTERWKEVHVRRP